MYWLVSINYEVGKVLFSYYALPMFQYVTEAH